MRSDGEGSDGRGSDGRKSDEVWSDRGALIGRGRSENEMTCDGERRSDEGRGS